MESGIRKLRAWLHPGWLLLVGVAPPLVVRATMWIDRGVSPSSVDLRGVGVDVVAGLLAGLVILLLHRFSRVPATLAALGWVVAGFLAAEHVRALGAWPSVDHAGYLVDWTMLFGSVLRPSHLWLMLGVAAAAVAAVWLIPQAPVAQCCRWTLMAVGVGGIAVLQTPSDSSAEGWRQTNFLAGNLQQMVKADRGDAAIAAVPIGAAHRARVDRILCTDLDAPRLIEPLPPQTNVLLLVVEGLSADRLGQRETAGRARTPLPYLTSLSCRGLYADRFVNQQRQTNRGTYGLLAGDLPLLRPGTPRMSSFSAVPAREYLPSALALHGYHTAYLQSAPLAFMGKEPFLRAAGFAEVRSAADREPAHARNAWGVDDLTLMDAAAETVDRLEAGEKPWLLTVLTAGTHHPYLLPAGEPVFDGEDEVDAAFRYADRAVAHLLRALERRGVLANTLVVITSDETGAPGQDGRGSHHAVAPQRGVLIALAPGLSAQRAEGLFAQSDLAVSVLDGLGLDPRPHGFIGRSVFRRYDRPRDVPYGDAYARKVGLFTERGTIARFNPALESAGAWRIAGDPFRDLVPADADRDARAVLAELIRRQEASAAAADGTAIELLRPGRLEIAPAWRPPADPLATAESPLTGWQAFATETDSVLVVDLDVAVPADAVGEVGLRLAIGGSHQHTGQAASADLRTVAPGERLTRRLAYRTGGPVTGFRVVPWAKPPDGQPATLVVYAATLRIVRADTWAGAAVPIGQLMAVDSQ